MFPLLCSVWVKVSVALVSHQTCTNETLSPVLLKAHMITLFCVFMSIKILMLCVYSFVLLFVCLFSAAVGTVLTMAVLQ